LKKTLRIGLLNTYTIVTKGCPNEHPIALTNQTNKQFFWIHSRASLAF